MSAKPMLIFDEDGRRVPYAFDERGFGEAGTMEPSDAGPPSIDLRAIWSALYRNRWLMIVALALSLAVGFGITLLTTPIYRANTTVQIEQQTARLLAGQDVAGSSTIDYDMDRYLATQLDIIRSRTIAERVVDSLGLARSDGFLKAMGVKTPATPDRSPGAATTRRAISVGMVEGNMDVKLPRNSHIAVISFDSPDPQTAATLANSYADNYIVSNLRRNYDASAYARNFLQQQLVQAKQRLEDAERASIAYARSAGLIDASNSSATEGASAQGTGPKSLVTSTLVQTNTSLTSAIAARIAAEQRWNQAQHTPDLNLPEVQSAPAVQQLLQQRAQLTATFQQQREQHKDDYPIMRQLSAQLAELDRQIARIAASIKSSIRDQYMIALKQESALQSNVGQLKGQTLAEQDRSVRLNILRREVDTSRTLYDGLLQRYKEVSAAAGIVANNLSIVDRAMPPGGPIRPRPLVNLALAGIIGLILGGLLTFLRETLMDSIRSSDDMSRKLGIPLLGAVPLLPSGVTPPDALADVRSAFAEAHYTLRSSLELARAAGAPRTLLCTSSQQGEGKSTTAVALAYSFARLGRRVVLIDADLRKPSLHRVVGLPNTVGLSNVLTRQISIDDAIQRAELPNLDIITCGPLPPNPADLLASSQAAEVIEHLSRLYDVVLIDGPPVMGLSDSPLLAALVQGVIFVVEANRPHHGTAKFALRRLRESRAVILGGVLTKYDERVSGYGEYKYRYDYGRAAT